jgi:hypothetical protein
MPSLWDYVQEYPGRLRDQFTQGMQQFARTRNPVAALGALNPTTPFIQDAALQAGGLIAPQANQLNQAVSQASENLGLGPLSIPEVTDEQLAPFLMLGMGSPSKMGFFSPSGKALTTAPGKGTSKQYLAHLKKEPGATKEAKQTGLIQKLEEAPGTLTKEEVVSMWNPIELTETVKGPDTQASKNYVPENRSRWVPERWQSEIDEAERAGDFSRAEELTRDWEFSEGVGVGSTKYGNEAKLNLPGGEEPKEILVQLPETIPTELPEGFSIKPLSGHPRGYRWALERPDGTGMAIAQENYEDALNDVLNNSVPFLHRSNLYKSDHWDEPNVLAHIRTNKRDVGGVRALHAEEFQSDWHQQGQKRGYQPTDPGPTDFAIVETDRGEFAVQGIDSNGVGHRMNTFATREDAQEQIADYKSAGVPRPMLERFRTSGQGVPDAPFKKDWHELAFKRFLMEGINDPSVDRITWTSGDVQADRYDLSRQIEEINVGPSGSLSNPDTLTLEIISKPDQRLDQHFFIKKEDLPDYVGKEMADKIISDADGTLKTYSGLDLQVGGEFHKNLYDKKIPQFAKKFLKKYGVEPQKIAIWGTDPSIHVEIDDSVPDRPDFDVYQDGRWVRSLPSMEAVEQEFGKENQFWYIDITPEMRRDLQQKGVPLAMNNRRPQAGLLA